MPACAELGAWEAVQLDKQLLKAEVRPGVFESIRMQADEETRVLLTNLKVHQPRTCLQISLRRAPAATATMLPFHWCVCMDRAIQVPCTFPVGL